MKLDILEFGKFKMLRLLILIICMFITATTVFADTKLPNRHGVPDFAANPTVTSVQSGSWFDQSTWSPSRVPTTEDVVKINTGHSVNYMGVSDDPLAVIGIKGSLTFSTVADSRLKVGTILVYPEGTLNIGTKTNPVPSNVNVEIIIADRPLASSAQVGVSVYDPLQYGTGIIGFGETNVHGAAIPRTWLSFAVEPMAGHNSLVVESAPVGWKVGDTLIIPGTKAIPAVAKPSSHPLVNFEYEYEKAVITEIKGNTISIQSPLQYDHPAPRYSDGSVFFMPHVGNLTRNVTIKSADNAQTRGHILFAERADVEFRYAAINGLGRTKSDPLHNSTPGSVVGTNQIGRYSIHMHHLMGPINPDNTGYQFVIEGISIDGGEKWGITIHNSHFGLIHNNVVFDIAGASIITEQANETGNYFTDNLMVKVGPTPMERIYEPRYGGVAGLNPPRPVGFGDFGYEGSALWATGTGSTWTGNVSANATYAGLMINTRLVGFVNNHPSLPLVRGADLDNPAQWNQVPQNKLAPPMVDGQFDNNTTYANGMGFWVSFTSRVGPISNTKIAASRQKGLYNQRNASVVYNKLEIINEYALGDSGYDHPGIDIENPSYHSGKVDINDFRVEGFRIGITTPTSIFPSSYSISKEDRVVTLANGYMKNYINIVDYSPKTVKKVVFKDVLFERFNGRPGKREMSESTDFVGVLKEPYRDAGILTESNFKFVNYNKVPGANYDIFYNEQKGSSVMPTRSYRGVELDDQNCPTLGMTNSECKAAHNVAILGQPSTCEINELKTVRGIACASGSTTPPIPPLMVNRKLVN